MTPPGQVIAAALPASPTVALPVPAPSAGTGALPRTPVTVIDGTRVPVVPTFVYAAFAGAAGPAAPSTPSATAAAASSGAGLLTAATRSSQSVVPGFGDTASPTARVVVGSGGAVVLSAWFDADTRAVAADAAFSGTGELATVTVTHCDALPSFYALGTATAAVSSTSG
ncbi:hypothetical protein [Nocardia lijiangensis]|uniref:hypothetical protein n=1 Tax=Nocardia lijiangensis TaxID=299618 RepID=UPI000AF75BA8|nr:hypothetical protein [Nocardia lijiangensis]